MTINQGSISFCEEFNIDEITDSRGSLSYLEIGKGLSFPITRNYFLYDIRKNETRGHHAHKKLQQVIVCLSGSCNITLYDGKLTKKISLNSPTSALFICPMIWRVMSDFTENAILSVLASEPYDESDYIRDIAEFEILQQGHV
jgi:dTDP-4-dehydrorhamnose 3,5-epimerase-like enzyme